MKHISISQRKKVAAEKYEMFINGQFNTAIPPDYNFLTGRRDLVPHEKRSYKPNVKILD